MSPEWEEFLNQLKRKADLPRVAERLGMKLWRRESEVPQALCPFHDDSRPSLSLYRNQGGLGAYHCFACNEHGDVFDLVAKREGLTFKEAVEWLADFLGESLPQRTRGQERSQTLSPRPQGLKEGLEIFRSQNPDERRQLALFAEKRDFREEDLRVREVFAVEAGKLSRRIAELREKSGLEMRELEAELEAAGLLVRDEGQGDKAQEHLPFRQLKDFYWDRRILFAIRGHRGELAGFAGRATDDDAQPKYLYSRGFERASVLYRLDRVLDALRKRRKAVGTPRQKPNFWSLDLYVVEGPLDALRLESLGLQACAILGSSLTSSQAALLSEVAGEVMRGGGALAIHLFLDDDQAGRAGGARAVLALWETFLHDDVAPVLDVVAIRHELQNGADPDRLLRDKTSQEARDLVSQSLVSTVQLLLANSLKCGLREVDNAWACAVPLTQQWILQGLESKFPREKWRAAFRRFRPFATALTTESQEPTDWQEAVQSFLWFADSDVADKRTRISEAATASQVKEEPVRSDTQQLQLAHQLAMTSRHRREFPIDEAGWVRLGTAFDVVAPFYKAVLATAKAQRLEPYLAVYLPKSSGGIRLKALPCPEDLTLQQYMLNELLRFYPEHPNLAAHIPAVRWQDGRLLTTGWSRDGEAVVRKEVVSYAYQVDMDVLEGRVPAGQRAMFRPYFECWKDFIRFLSESVTEFGDGNLFRLRLDIRSFYDHLRRAIVNEALRLPLEKALRFEGFDPRMMAPLLGTHRRTEGSQPEDFVLLATERARSIVDWLCDHSFHYPYIDPDSGEARRSSFPDTGIPQGPDLSAYLANVSLFRMDQVVTEEIERLEERSSVEGRTTRVALYGRYVDDIVLVARSPEELEQLRSLIEEELARIGLSLSRKTEPLAPMNRDDLRRWFTDQRSLGAGYGPVPGIDPNLILSSPGWGDAGMELDRGTALQLLHGHDAATVLEKPDQVLRDVELARQAELRPGDEAVVAKLLWLVVASHKLRSAVGAQVESEELVHELKSLWQRADILQVQELPLAAEEDLALAFHRSWPVFAWLEGLLLALRWRADRSPQADSEAQGEWSQIRTLLARQIERGLCDRILAEDTEAPASDAMGRAIGVPAFAHQKAIWCRVLLAAAAETLDQGKAATSSLPGEFAWKEGVSLPTLFRHACTLHTAYPSSGILETVRRLPKEGTRVEEHGLAELLFLHEAIARLSCAQEATPEDSGSVDALQPMESSVGSRILGAATLPSSISLLNVLQFWLPDGQNEPATWSRGLEASWTLPVVTAFVNVARGRTPTLLARRQWLRQILLDHHKLPRDVTFLPVPPGVSYPGLLAICGTDLVAFLFGLSSEHLKESTWPPPCLAEFQPPLLKWNRLAEPTDETAQLPWLCVMASLGGWSLQQPAVTPLIHRKDEAKVWTLSRIGAAFRSLSESQRGIGNLCAVASAAHLLMRQSSDGRGVEEWSLLGFALPREALASQGFVRLRHSGSLLAEPVPAEGADLWRLGLALADFHLAVEREKSDPTSAFSAAALSLHKDQDPAVEAMLRSTLARLRGLGVSSGPLTRHADDFLPQMVVRALDRIVGFRRAFDKHERGRVLAFALGCFLENRLERDMSALDTRSGRAVSAAARLTRSARFLLGADAKLNQALPMPPTLPGWIPVRRPTRAWMMVAERLSLLPRVDEAELIALAVAGYRLLGLTELLRAFALERWTALEQARRRADKWTLDLSEWGVNATELLVGGEDCEPPMAILERLPLQVSPKELSRLEMITPLGWLAVVAALSGLLPGNDFQPGLRGEGSGADTIREGLKQLAVLLAEPWQPKVDSTWRGFRNLIDAFGPSASAERGTFAGVLRALHLLDKEGGVEVVFEESDRVYMSAREGHTWEVRSERFFAQEVPLWSIRELHLQSRRERWEEAPRRNGEYQIQRRATLSAVQGRLVGASWITRELAELAGLAQDDRGEAPIQRSPEVRASAEGPTVARWQPETLAPDVSSCPSAGSDPLVVGSHVTEAAAGVGSAGLQELQRLQRGEWRRRSRSKRGNTARIALLQWSVDETYRHPIFEICHNVEGWRALARRRETPTEVLSLVESNLTGNRELRRSLNGPGVAVGDTAQSRPSCAEHRRRRILTEALAACGDLGVDVLLLPEYSTRPDTIAWLSDPNKISTTTSVWAGTYRLPPGGSPSLGIDPGGIDTRGVWSAILSAVLPVLGPPPHRVVRWRAKKYPSQALAEVFNPRKDRLEPLFPQQGMSQSVFDPKRYVLELICSEIFLATSPTNWKTLASSLSDLSYKFQPNAIAFKEALERVLEDIEYLADYFSYQSDTQFPRRSILLVPSMTPRTVDYAAFGQLNYLSAGLTTVFCNAVLGRKAIGNSCFIGHDCWDRTDHHSEEGMPGLSPYHGLTPGIFRQHALGRGWLGSQEQALVVADVDPLHSVEGKPRPQSLPPPLSLVAHIPVIESWTKERQGCHSGDEPEPCRCSRSRRKSFEAEDFKASDLIEVLRRNADQGVVSTSQDHSPRELANLLRKLAKRAGHKDADWLCRRAEAYEKFHLNDPVAWPPPVALDWLWVELGEAGDMPNYPVVEVPPFRWAPGEEGRERLEVSGEQAAGDSATSISSG